MMNKRIVLGVLAIIGAVCIAIALIGLATPVVAESPRERFFEIYAKRFEYTPSVIQVNQGDKVTIRLISEDVSHGLYVDGYEVKTVAHPGESATLTFVADKVGRYAFRCTVTCGEFHPYMIGYLSVEPNVRLWALALLVVGIALCSVVILGR
jgi:cytochrome c oxidase subunit 2